ncbi:restriction endonuclease [Streptomyces griseus]|uniref:restriction endonuclease n=1 Tax=Streptomyces griseus TaxID=1911 RepID=UPI0013B76A49|nr:restriction endonuclease [Streptomyces griseus]
MSSTVVHDPSGVVTGGLPLDRGPHLALATAVLARGPAPARVQAADRALIGLQLTGHAQCVATDLRHQHETLPSDSELRPLTRVVLREAANRPSTGPATTVARVQEPGPTDPSPLPRTRPTRHHAAARTGHLNSG